MNVYSLHITLKANITLFNLLTSAPELSTIQELVIATLFVITILLAWTLSYQFQVLFLSIISTVPDSFFLTTPLCALYDFTKDLTTWIQKKLQDKTLFILSVKVVLQ